MAEENKPDDMTTEEKKFLMQAIWNSLLGPKWTKDDLIDLGKAIFSKKKLRDIDEKTFTRLFPHLKEIVISLGEQLRAEADKQAKQISEQPVENKNETQDTAQEETPKE